MEEITDDRWITRQELADRYGVPVKMPAQWASKGSFEAPCEIDNPSLITANTA